ncbi:tRNA (adenosine(37)-N6)-dimethylallyltransferase MiaA [Patescibacteria group bacterium]|nr:tRNA (adenosine(37)-N6)-dimethylallyltransferase MiaA [Patescibacteria group bacterium]
MQNPIIVITGATASGKTAISFDIAPKFDGEVICADSMTVYRGMDIGTDKPTLLVNDKKQLTKNKDGAYIIKGIPHHLLDILEPNDDFNVAIFKTFVEEKVSEIHARGKMPILVGGSLLYIDSFAYDFLMPEVKPDEKLRKELNEKSEDELFEQLVELDPDAEWTVDKKNKRRVIRALEVCLKTGQPFTAQKKNAGLRKNLLYLAVDREREELNKKINKRVNEMMEAGFLKEVKVLYKKYDHSTAMQATGYRQLIDYIEGKISLDKAIEETKRSHRKFAKRQQTWLRRNQDKTLIRSSDDAEREIRKFIEN